MEENRASIVEDHLLNESHNYGCFKTTEEEIPSAEWPPVNTTPGKEVGVEIK